MSFEQGFTQGAAMVRSATDTKLRRQTFAENKRMNDIAAREALEDRKRLVRGRKSLVEFNQELESIDWTAEDASSRYDDAVRRYSFQANMHPTTAKAFDAIHNATLQNRALTDRRIAQSAQTAALGQIMRDYPDIGGNITAKMRKGEDIDWEDVYKRVESRREKGRQQEIEQYRARGEAYYGSRPAPVEKLPVSEPSEFDKQQLRSLFTRRDKLEDIRLEAIRDPKRGQALKQIEAEIGKLGSQIDALQPRFSGQAASEAPAPDASGKTGEVDLESLLMKRFADKYGNEGGQ